MNVAVLALLLAVSAMALAAIAGPSASAKATPTFTNFLLTPMSPGQGDSEPAVAIGPDGSVVLGGLDWFQFQTDVWKGSFGTAPSPIGPIDAHIGTGIGGGDEDIDFGSTGTLHASTLMFIFNPKGNAAQLGVSAVSCPN